MSNNRSLTTQKADATVHAASDQAARELRAPQVNNIILKLKSSQAYKDAGESLPSDRKGETVEGILQELPSYVLNDLLASKGLEGQTSILKAITKKLNPPTVVNEPNAELVIKHLGLSAA